MAIRENLKPESDRYSEREENDSDQEHWLIQQVKTESEIYRERDGGQQSIVPDGGYTPPEPACVYVLECGKPDNVEIVDERTKRIKGHSDRQMRKAFHSSKRFQIGATQSIPDRFHEHINAEASMFTKVFPLKELRELRWCSSFSEARRLEEQTAIEYERKYKDAFIWQY